MREILFRGKDKENGKWITGFLVSSKHIGDWVTAWPVDPETVGQFTGLTDKDGTKIFEDDIVRYMNKETMVVSWRNESASFVCAYSAVNFNYCATLMNGHIYLEVIGNIHDNPELLEGLKWQ